MLHDKLIDAALATIVPADGLDPGGLYASLLDLAGRMLGEVESGHQHADAGWAWQVLQVQVPALRAAAGIVLDPPRRSELHPLAEREREIRERYGIPA
jgi:hypothetical protein